ARPHHFGVKVRLWIWIVFSKGGDGEEEPVIGRSGFVEEMTNRAGNGWFSVLGGINNDGQ
ncbi:MAG: hypothetical protein WBC82_01090, partial [Dehalococcoidia bacterium]